MRSKPLVLGACLMVLVGASRAWAGQQPAAQPPAQAQAGGQQVTLTLANGTRLVGTVTSQEGGKVHITVPQVGDLVIDQAQVIAINDQPVGQPTAGAAAPPTGQAPPTASPAFAAQAKWTRQITFGGSFTSAAFKQGPLLPAIPQLTGEALKLQGDQFSGKLSAMFMRSSAKDAFSAEGSYTLADYEPFGRQTEAVTGDFAYNRKLTQRAYFVARSSYRRDKVKGVDYAFTQLFGVGRAVIDTQRTRLDLIPGVILLRQKQNSKFDEQWFFGGGGFESFAHAFNQFVMFEQRALFRAIFDESDLWGFDGYAGFKGMLNKAVGVTFGLTYVYDNSLGFKETQIPANALFPGSPLLTIFANEKGQVFLTGGLQVNF